ncbi:hypothetical protein [Alteromonas oceanisediminis]|uniref:hypothetical protein n=1 Tax=Alteromonas oceanisediminis TaxID=2836180 RepID=UPI001BD9ECDE|nr:hypothetical protein [Alteromonas oceanisediminis]MBT0586542.1 hypothetical protein [Alteromonas oceanisediminis]
MSITTQNEYVFDDEPHAYRFLNAVKNWQQMDLKAEFGRDASHVKITYQPRKIQFDDTVSRLDDLALQHNGSAL